MKAWYKFYTFEGIGISGMIIIKSASDIVAKLLCDSD